MQVEPKGGGTLSCGGGGVPIPTTGEKAYYSACKSLHPVEF